MHRRNDPSAQAFYANVSNNVPGPAQPGFYTSGISGGDIRVSWIGTPDDEISAGDWVMLAHDRFVARKYGQFLPRRPVPAEHKWYRVTSTGQNVGGVQDITLSGPDWNPNWSSTLTGERENTVMIWMPQVVSVYTKSTRLPLGTGGGSNSGGSNSGGGGSADLQSSARQAFDTPSNFAGPLGL